MRRTATRTKLAPVFFALLLFGVRALAQDSAEVRAEPVQLKAQDGGSARAILRYMAGTKPKVVFVTMHPRNDMTMDWRLTPLAKLGIATLGMAPRETGCSGIHEEMLLDIASAIKWLKEVKKFETVVVMGQSGGGSLMAYYQAQAETAPPNRVKETPAGDPPNLNEFDLPRADGFITMNAAEGEGLHIAHHLDPSVTDEDDPFSYDPSLDMYNPANGFRVPPEPTKYSPEFVARVRKAQQERAQRLVAIAKGRVEEQNFYRRLMKSPGFKLLSQQEQLMIQRRAEYEPLFIMYRTRADVRYYDTSIDPNDRAFGHYFAGFAENDINRSDLQNWAQEERLRCVTTRSFLSTESIASNARLWDSLKKISVPVLVMNGTADPGIHPSEADRTFASVVSKDKERIWIVGANHGWQGEGAKKGNGDQREQALRAVKAWIEKRWKL